MEQNPNPTRHKSGSNQVKPSVRKRAERPLVYELVKIDHNEVVTDSRIVAERFDKDHKNVVRDIRAMIGAPSGGSKLSRETSRGKPLSADEIAVLEALRQEFSKGVHLATYKDERGKDQPYYLLGKEAARKLTLGFTGERAEMWQFLFVKAFAEMEKELQRQRSNETDPERQIERSAGIVVRRSFTDVCQEFERYGLVGREKGSGMSYMNYTKFINKSLFEPEDGIYAGIRKRRLETQQLKDIAMVERVGAKCLQECMAKSLRREECRPAVEETLSQLCAMIGRTSVPPLKDVRALPGMENAA